MKRNYPLQAITKTTIRREVTSGRRIVEFLGWDCPNTIFLG